MRRRNEWGTEEEAGGGKWGANADAVGRGAAGDAAGGAVWLVDDAGGIGAEDEVCGDEYFSAIAAFAEREARSVSGGEEKERVAGGVAEEYAGEGLGIPGERVRREVGRGLRGLGQKNARRSEIEEGSLDSVSRRAKRRRGRKASGHSARDDRFGFSSGSMEFKGWRKA